MPQPNNKPKQKKPPQNNGGNNNGRKMKSPTQRANEKRANGRRQAQREERRNSEFASKLIDLHDVFDGPEKGRRANLITQGDKLRVIPIGGNEGGGGKNMVVLEYKDEAIIIDCGFNLSVDLPGVNYGINATEYLEKIRHKIKAYVFTHGHLDHIGATPYIIPEFPAPVFGSQFTVSMIEKQFEDFEKPLDFKPETHALNMDTHERHVISKNFTIELVRVTHSIPECSLVVVDTPVGRIINTGDFRLDPEPLDHMPSDIERMKQLGKEGVALLMSESTTTYKPGRTPTEHTLIDSFKDVIARAPGRIFIASFSSNINRVQMIIDGAVAANRKVAIDGRSMLAHVELAVKMGLIKIPKGTIIAMRSAVSVPDDQLIVIATGGQGEMNASLQRMSVGEHKHIKLKSGDTVVVSSSPIPGNEVRYEQIGDDLIRKGVFLFRAPTHEIDGCGPLHVSGHASRDEFSEMIRMMQPKFFMPIYSGPRNRAYHVELAVEEGIPRKNTFMADNGEVLEIDEKSAKLNGSVPVGTVLIDQTGEVVPGVVAKDRLLMSENGIVTVILTMKKSTGELLSSPDIISRGFVYLRENEELMNEIRKELKFFAMRRFKQTPLKDFKAELKDIILDLVYRRTNRSPLVIPVVNVVGGGNGNGKPARKRAELQANESHD